MNPGSLISDRKAAAAILWTSSLIFFILGFNYPMLESGFGIGPFTFKHDYIYLGSSFNYFFSRGEIFIGSILLTFTIILPILKYVLVLLTLTGRHYRRFQVVMEIIQKWAMLDVFVVAVLILNLKFDSTVIISRLGSGTSLFALSVILLMICSLVLKQKREPVPGKNK